MSDPEGAAEARGRPRATTTVVGVIGWPASQSLSPVIHNAAFAALGLDWVYVALPVEPGRVADALRGLVALGLAGANVTMPHKTEVAGLVDERSEDAERLKAVNTIVVGPHGLAGHNTDAPGFERFLRRDVGFEPEGRRALLFGAGGAARACALALAKAGLASLTVAVRDPGRATALREAVSGLGAELDVIRFDDALARPADLIVNATPLGRRGEKLPLPALGPEVVAVDLLYGAGQTPLQAATSAAGGAAFGGLGLLLRQAGLSFELWTAQPAPLDVMSAAALAELADAGEAGGRPSTEA